MAQAGRHLWRSEEGSVAPLVAISLFALIGAAGIGFDYARMAGMDSELQSVADQAALAAASQLDGKTDAIARATRAARQLIANETRFANDGKSGAVSGTDLSLVFYDGYDRTSDTYGTVTTTDATAAIVKVTTAGREAFFALTPVVAALRSGSITASATAGLGQSICKVPPVMICNPGEPANNTDENLAFTPVAGLGLKLVTGNADAPGNFGWLDAGLGNGAPGLSALLGNDALTVDCQPVNGVTTSTGMKTSVMDAFNTRFDIYNNGNIGCSGPCSPSTNVRKDMVCKAPGASCTGNYDIPANFYQPPYPPVALASDGSQDPPIMGYPVDICHAVAKKDAATCGVIGNGTWDRAAFFRVNYGSAFDWQTAMANAGYTAATVTRYQVYQWELANPSVVVGGAAKGISVPQPVGSNDKAFGQPANGVAGISPSSGIDRRRLSVAVINCNATNLHGKTTNVPVSKWLDVFLVQPVATRGNGTNAQTDMSDIYVEEIGETGSGIGGASTAQVIQRAVPYLIR